MSNCLEHSVEVVSDGLNHIHQIGKRFNDRLALKPIRLAERYIKGELNALVCFTVAGDLTQYVALLKTWGTKHYRELGRFGSHFQLDGLSNVGANASKNNVFICDVQCVEGPQSTPVPTSVGCYLVDDLFGRNRHTFCLSSRFGYVLLGTLADRKVDIFRASSCGTYEFAGEIVQGCPQVVSGVPCDKGQTFGNLGEGTNNGLGDVSFAVEMGSNYIRVSPKESNSLRIEITDVLFGPFDFGTSAGDVNSHERDIIAFDTVPQYRAQFLYG